MKKKQAIKEIIMKYLEPKPEYDGTSSDEIAGLILTALAKPEMEEIKEIPQFKGTMEKLDKLTIIK
jgi:hypothetical protein